jgi:PAS domain S-box-containing protein
MNASSGGSNSPATGQTPQSPQTEEQLFADQVRLVYQQVPAVFAGVLINAVVLTIALWTVIAPAVLLTWLGAQVAVVALRLLLIWRYRRSSGAPSEARKWKNRYLAGILATGILWGLTGIVLFPPGQVEYQVFISFLAGGLSIGSVAVYAVIPRMASAFYVPALAPLIVRFFLQGGALSTWMGTMILVFLVLIATISRNIHNIVVNFLRLRLENVGLVIFLTESKRLTDSLNEELKAEIHERAQAEAALRTSEEKFRALVENAIDAILLVVDERVRYANRATLELVGYDEVELLQRPLTDFMAETPQGRELICHHHHQGLAGQPVPAQYEAQLVRKDGTLIDVIISSARVNLGEQTGVIALIKDITERKHAELEMQRSKERTEEANKLKDQFVSLVAHDLKSPLTSIFGMVQILHEDKEQPLSEHQKEVMGAIMRGGETLMRTIDDLLNISRLQTGKIKPSPKFLDGYAIADAAIDILSHLASDKGITLRNQVPPNTRLFADPELMAKVIQNLVANAIKFCKRGDRITVFVPENRGTTLAVQDTGLGISAGKLSDLFNPEAPTTSPGTAGERGTGLGLLFSQDMMQAQGGEITVESEEGRGSTFYARLPEVRPRILLVGSNEFFRQLLKRQIEGIQADFLPAQGMGEAVAALDNDQVHLVITDSQLPGGDGFELVRHIRNSADYLAIPVILILDSSESEAVEKAFRLGADDTIVKPLIPYDFVSRLRRFIR